MKKTKGATRTLLCFLVFLGLFASQSTVNQALNKKNNLKQAHPTKNPHRVVVLLHQEKIQRINQKHTPKPSDQLSDKGVWARISAFLCFFAESFSVSTPIKEGKTIIAPSKSGINMSEQPNEQTNPQPKIEKLLIDNPENFPFHAAYLVYEESFDKANDPNSKLELNQNIQDLYESKIDNATFYMNVSRYRKVDAPRQERFSMQTQRKRDWRKKEQRQDRIKRHKK